jgi:hypothetical protein
VPTILFVMGWRLFFYANEKNEPIHIHCQKAELECKYWLGTDDFTLEEAYAYNMNNRDRREIKRIIYQYFDFIEKEWQKQQEGTK